MELRLARLVIRIIGLFGLWEFLLKRIIGPRAAAVAFLTLKSASRYRIVLALSFLLGATVIVLPLMVKDDGTARGMTQILLTYTLGTVTALLGFATLWLSCGTLAKDIEECQIQVVASKPIARWEIWLGKWAGIMVLNAMLLLYSGIAIYGLINIRASRLSENEQAVLRNEVLVGRKSAKETPPNVDADVEALFKERIKDEQVAQMDPSFIRKEIKERLLARDENVASGYLRRWEIPLGESAAWLRDKPFNIRVKFHAAKVTMQTVYIAQFAIGKPETRDYQYLQPMRLAVDMFHEIPIPPNKFDDNGVLTVDFHNYNQDGLLFPLDDGFEVLYRESGFGLNFFRGLFIVYLWLALLSALGLAAASYLSFPVAAFASLAVLVIGLSSGLLANVIKEGTVAAIDHETGVGSSPVDVVMLPLFKVLLNVINLVQSFSPIDSLSSGRSVTWGQLALAFSQIGLLVSGTFICVGIALFYRRELAAVQSGTMS